MGGAASVLIGNAQLVMIVGLTISPTIVNANTTSEQTFTIKGMHAGDFVYVNKPTSQTGLILGNARVSSNDNIAIQWANVTGSNITPTANELYTILIIRCENYVEGLPTGISA